MTDTTELLTTREAAEYLHLREQTLHLWRCVGRYDLPFVRIGRTVRYRREDLERFVSSKRETPNTEPAAAIA